MEKVPIIYTWRPQPARLGLTGRLAALAGGLGCLTVLLLALRAPPSPTGVGTHTRLGLSRCDLLERTGVPCMTCGMTTSFAHFVRGNLPASFYVQPLGMLLALTTAAGVWVGLYIALTARPVHRLLRFLPTRYYLLPLLTLALLAWIWKILIHVKGWDGWG